MTFEQAYEFTKTIGSHTSFEEEECRAYFDVLMSLAPGSRIVEIGLEFGRSSSIALQVAKERGLKYSGFDPFEYEETFLKWEEMAKSVGVEYEMRPHRSLYMAAIWDDEPISAILIDGDHEYSEVKADCDAWLPIVRARGFAMFHDYRRESLPEVTKAVNEYMLNGGWAQMETVGTLGIWRKR